MHDNSILEVAIFTLKAGFHGDMPELRRGLRSALRAFPGLVEFHGYSPLQDERYFADIARWDSLEHAQAAATAFAQGDPRFAPYMHAIEELVFMGHFHADIA
ncbi:MAG: hypothetical protein ABWY06_03245 [Pseudomonas sp.]|uniref:antibiotic biosynthesis monooxygenase family protein n=1 Tax=Pseudomonas sp. TaxID=306 RepID=UPI0033909C6B